MVFGVVHCQLVVMGMDTGADQCGRSLVVVGYIRKRLLASETPRDTQSSLGVSGDSKDIKDLNILP